MSAKSESMGKPLSPKEQDNIQKWSGAGLTPVRIHDKLHKARLAKRQPGPDLTTVRRLLKGKTFKKAAQEKRGRLRRLSEKNVKPCICGRTSSQLEHNESTTIEHNSFPLGCCTSARNIRVLCL